MDSALESVKSNSTSGTGSLAHGRVVTLKAAFYSLFPDFIASFASLESPKSITIQVRCLRMQSIFVTNEIQLFGIGSSLPEV